MVEKGRMGLEVNGKAKIVTPEDGVIVGPAGCLHRFWVAEDSVEDMIIVLNATDAAIDYQLDRVFFENWYGFRQDSLTQGKGMDVIQMLSVRGLDSLPESLLSLRKWSVTSCKNSADRLILVLPIVVRRWGSLHSCPRMGTVPCLGWILDYYYRWTVDRRSLGLQAFLSRIHHRLGIRG